MDLARATARLSGEALSTRRPFSSPRSQEGRVGCHSHAGHSGPGGGRPCSKRSHQGGRPVLCHLPGPRTPPALGQPCQGGWEPRFIGRDRRRERALTPQPAAIEQQGGTPQKRGSQVVLCRVPQDSSFRVPATRPPPRSLTRVTSTQHAPPRLPPQPCFLSREHSPALRLCSWQVWSKCPNGLGPQRLLCDRV